MPRPIQLASVVPLAALCGAALCVSLPSSGRPAPRGGAAAAPDPGHGQESLGAAVAAVGRAGGARALRLPGRVVPDETRVYRVNAGMPGSMRDVAPVVTGSRVTKDQVLGSFWATEQLMTLKTFLMNTHGFDPYDNGGRTAGAAEIASRARGSLYQANLQQRVQELENMGVSAVQRGEIARTGRIPETIEVRAPADGVVVARDVTPGQKFERGYELFRVVDLRRVWVVADVYPEDARHVRPGLRAEVSVPELDVRLAATIDRILPEVDPAARTTKVRLEVENPREALLPGMFVDVRVDAELPPALVAPADAVVASGAAETVFVAAAGGGLEPRAVKTGWRSADRVEIVEGLSPGDRVATAGAFLLDSESRLRAPGAAESSAARPGL